MQKILLALSVLTLLSYGCNRNKEKQEEQSGKMDTSRDASSSSTNKGTNQ
jgi:hypothetical protein